jgi:homoserine O-acetyltransferase
VLILHGTGGTGQGFLSPTFGGGLFGAGQPLDATRYFIVLPDGIGHGKSTKPSDGLHARFPKYTYDDMVRAEHQLLTDGLKVGHLRLVLGTSMGAMHCWIWGEMFPDFVDGLVPLASAPTQIAGRNRVMRKMIMDSITSDPHYNNGDYTEQPREGLVGAINLLMMMTSSPLQWHKSGPTPRTNGTRIRSARGWRRPTQTTCCTNSTPRAITIRRRISRRSRRPFSPSTPPTTW